MASRLDCCVNPSEIQLLKFVLQELEEISDAEQGELSAGYTDGSGTSTGASQQVFAANAARKYLLIINNSDTEMWVNSPEAASASQPSIRLVPNGGFFEPLLPPNGPVNLFCASAGKSFTAKQAV